MKKAISMAMALTVALTTAATTVPVMADDPVELTIWSPTDTAAIEAGGKRRSLSGMRRIRISR